MLTLWRTTPSGVASFLDEATREMSRLVDTSLPAQAWATAGLTPAADVAETEAAFEVVLDLPGQDPKAIDLQVEKDVLTVKADRKFQEPGEGRTVHRSERAFGTFFRSFTLPRSVDATRVEARYEHGVLTVVLPKREEARARSIAVQVR
jgi:HSP20 family protein